MGGALVVMGLVLYVPYLRDIFRFAKLPPGQVAICLGAGLVGVLWFEALKVFRGDQGAP